MVTVDQIVTRHWRTYGRNFYTRYDYGAPTSYICV